MNSLKDKLTDMILKLKCEIEAKYGSEHAKKLIEQNFPELASEWKNEDVQVKAFWLYGDVRFSYEGFLTLLPNALKMIVNHKASAISREIFYFVDDAHELIVSDGLYEKIYDLFNAFVVEATNKYVLSGKTVVIDDEVQYLMEFLMTSVNYDTIVHNWVEMAKKTEDLGHAIWLLELAKSSCYCWSNINRSSFFDVFRKNVFLFFGNPEILQNKLQQIKKNVKEGVLPQEYLFELEEDLPEGLVFNDENLLLLEKRFEEKVRLGI